MHETLDVTALGSDTKKAAPEKPPVTARHVMAAFRESRPSMTPEEHARYDNIYAKFTGGRGAATKGTGDAGYNPLEQRTALA